MICSYACVSMISFTRIDAQKRANASLPPVRDWRPWKAVGIYSKNATCSVYVTLSKGEIEIKTGCPFSSTHTNIVHTFQPQSRCVEGGRLLRFLWLQSKCSQYLGDNSGGFACKENSGLFTDNALKSECPPGALLTGKLSSLLSPKY